MENLSFVSIVTKSHYADVRTLATTVRRFHPESRHYIFIIDASGRDDLPCAQSNEVLVPAIELMNSHEFMLLCFSYLPGEICCALKPLALKYAMSVDSGVAVYLDCDMTLIQELPTHCLPSRQRPISLTPQMIGNYGVAVAIRFVSHVCGHFNGGFVALFDCEASRQFCDVWWSLCRFHSVNNLSGEAIFADQGWLNLASVQFLDFVKSVDDPEINVGPWNIDLREQISAPVLVHWSGAVMTQVRDCIELPMHHKLEVAYERLKKDYAESKLATADVAVPYAFGCFRDGVRIPRAVRRYFLWQLRSVGFGGFSGFDPFANRGQMLREARLWYLRNAIGTLRHRIGWLVRDWLSLWRG